MDRTSDDAAQASFFDRFPADVSASLTPQQRAAVWSAVRPVSWRGHPIDIRLSLPFLGKRYYLTLVGGVERRSAERLRRERVIFPLRTLGNILFLLGVGGTMVVVAVLLVSLFSSLIQF